MSFIDNKKQSHGPPVGIILLALAGLGLTLTFLLIGKNIALLNPKGSIATQQRELIIFTLLVLLMIAIPTLITMYFFAWKYRDTNLQTKHRADHQHSKFLVTGIWLLPFTVMVILASVMWSATHRLAPQKVIASDTKPLTVQVISLRWKWLFLYPDQGIASVNFVQLPINTPVTFEMTADETPMSSFWIPNLGGQLYTMTSHVNRLNLMATTAGDYPGSTSEINGIGFAGMKFTARAGTYEDFNNFVYTAKQSPNKLSASAYQNLLKPSEYNHSAFYSSFEPTLYADVIAKYEGPGGHQH